MPSRRGQRGPGGAADVHVRRPGRRRHHATPRRPGGAAAGTAAGAARAAAAVVDTPEALAATCAAIAGGHRTGRDRRRAGLGLPLLLPRLPDPAAPRGRRHPPGRPDRVRVDGAARRRRSAGTEWILHAATQDLPCLAEIGLRPDALFDTELAGRLLGYPRVGLAALVELAARLPDGQGALGRRLVDPAAARAVAATTPRSTSRCWSSCGRCWSRSSRRPARTGWATEEFDALRDFTPTPRVDAWRRTSGLHKVRGRRSLGAVRALWQLRDEIAQERDVTPGRILPDTAIVAAATALPTHRRALLQDPGLPRPRRRALRLPLGVRAPGGVRAARGRAAGPRPPWRRPAGPARMGREGPGRREAAHRGPGRAGRPGRGAPPPGRERADPRPRPPAALDTAGHPAARPRWPRPSTSG